MNDFDIDIVHYFHDTGPIAEIYYKTFQWAQISLKNNNLIIEFYSHPKEQYPMFIVEDTIKVLELAKNKLVNSLAACSQGPENLVEPAVKNERAQQVLEKILHHPEKKIDYVELFRFGKVMEIYAPDLGGARYSTEGEFIGFLETKRMDKFYITVVSLPDREKLVSEILYSGVQWAELSQETGDEIRVQFYAHPRQDYWEFSIDEALEALQKAKQRLVGLGPTRADYGRSDLFS